MGSTDWRLRERADIRRVYRMGSTAASPQLHIKAIASPVPRVAVVVSTKISKKAVIRNRIRRRILELLRTELQRLPDRDMVLIVQADISELPGDALRELIFGCMARLP